MKISIIGCKYFKDYQVLKWQLDAMEISEITTCGENEIDMLAARYAKENNIKLTARWPEHQEGWFYVWKEYYRLIDCCDVLLAFWYGESQMVPCITNKAKRMGKEVILVRGYHSGKNEPKSYIN